jgi:hypothetical protein
LERKQEALREQDRLARKQERQEDLEVSVALLSLLPHTFEHQPP